MQVQAGRDTGLSQEVSWLRLCTDVVRTCLQAAHGVAHELQAIADVPGALVGRVARHRQRMTRTFQSMLARRLVMSIAARSMA